MRTHLLISLSVVSLIIFQNSAFTQPGIKVGITASSFIYTDKYMDPYRLYDIDLRPFLGYDIEWVQLGDQKALISPYISAYYNFQLSPRLGIRPEISFLQKGVNFNQYDYQKVFYKVKINYLEIPLSVSYGFIKRDKINCDIFTGGFGSVKLRAIKQTSLHGDEKEKSKLKTVQNFDAGIHLGLNCKYTIFEDFILLELRLFQGLTDIFEFQEEQISLYHQTQKTKLTGINISIGYEF